MSGNGGPVLDGEPPAGQGTMARQLWLLRIVCFLQFFALALLFSYETVWMKEQGMGEFFIGRTLAVATALGLVSGLAWGYLADATGRADRILFVGLIAVGLAIAFLTRCRRPAEFMLYAALRGVTQPMVWNMMPLLAVSVIEGKGAGRRYGYYRLFGSLGYAVSPLVLPALIDDIQLLLLAAAAAMALAPLPVLFFRLKGRTGRPHARILTVLRDRELLGLLAAVFFFGLASPAVYSFTSVYARKLGAGPRFIGLLTALMGWISVIGLPAAGLVADRIGLRRVLLLGLLAQPLRVLCLSLVTSYPYLAVPHVFHFFTFAGMEVAAVLFVTRRAGQTRRGTAMALYASARVLGSMLGAPVAGYLAENAGYPAMYRASAALAAVGVAVFAVAMIGARKRRKSAGRQI